MSTEAIDAPSSRGATVPAGRVLLVVLIGLVLGALLNADSLVERAERKPFGWSRSLSLAIWNPTQTISHALALDRPRAWVDDLTGRTGELPPGPTAGLVTPDEPTATTMPPPAQEPQLRTPTTAAPLRVWVGGDSMSQVFGQSLISSVSDTDLMVATLDYRISTGLTRPDFFNWPAHLSVEAERLDPEALVIMFGANDAQGLQNDDGEVFALLSDGWIAQYRLRVAATMDLLHDADRVVYWVGQPIMRSSSFSERMAGLNAIYRDEAESRHWVRYIDSYALFANDSGSYEAFLPGPDGRVQDLRQGDGVHLSRAGGDLLANRVLELIERDAKLR